MSEPLGFHRLCGGPVRLTRKPSYAYQIAQCSCSTRLNTTRLRSCQILKSRPYGRRAWCWGRRNDNCDILRIHLRVLRPPLVGLAYLLVRGIRKWEQSSGCFRVYPRRHRGDLFCIEVGKMTVRDLIANLITEPLDAIVLITHTDGDLYEARNTRFTWAKRRGGRFYRQMIKHDDSVVTAVEIVL